MDKAWPIATWMSRAYTVCIVVPCRLFYLNLKLSSAKLSLYCSILQSFWCYNVSVWAKGRRGWKESGLLLLFNPFWLYIKGSLTRDFRSQVLFMNQCPPSIGAVLNFFENSRRYSRINVPVSTTPAKNLSPVSRIKLSMKWRYSFSSDLESTLI